MCPCLRFDALSSSVLTLLSLFFGLGKQNKQSPFFEPFTNVQVQCVTVEQSASRTEFGYLQGWSLEGPRTDDALTCEEVQEKNFGFNLHDDIEFHDQVNLLSYIHLLAISPLIDKHIVVHVKAPQEAHDITVFLFFLFDNVCSSRN